MQSYRKRLFAAKHSNIFLLACTLGMCSPTCVASIHQINLNISASTLHTNNINNAINRKDSLMYSKVKPELVYLFKDTRVSNLFLAYSDVFMHEGRNELNYNNYSLFDKFIAQQETSDFSLSARATRETLREPTLTEFGGPDFKPTHSYLISTQLVKKLSARTSIDTTVSGSKKDYESQFYADYWNGSASFTISHLLSELFSVQLNTYRSRFESENSFRLSGVAFETNDVTTNTSDSYGLRVGFKGTAFSTLSYDVLLGGVIVEGLQERYTESEDPASGGIFNYQPITREDENFSALASITKQWEHSQLSASFNHDIQSTGNGIEYNNQTAKLNFSKELYKNLFISGSSTYSQQVALGESLPNFRFRDREYTQQQLSVSYSGSAYFSVTCFANYIESKYDGVNDIARTLSGGITFKVSNEFHQR